MEDKILLKDILALCEDSGSVAIYAGSEITSTASCLLSVLSDKILQKEVISLEGDSQRDGGLRVWIV